MAGRRKERLFQFSLYGLDTNLLVVLFFVMIFGFIMIYSASYYTAGLSQAYNHDPMYLLKNQVIYSILGIIVMLLVSCVNYHDTATIWTDTGQSHNSSWSRYQSCLSAQAA